MKTRVILYSLDFSAYIKNDDHVVLNVNSHFANGTALDIAAGVYDQLTIAAAGSAAARIKYVSSSIPYGLHLRDIPRHHYIRTESSVQSAHHDDSVFLLPWTEKREKFFADIGRALEHFIMQLHEITACVEVLQRRIDADTELKLLG